MKRNLFLLLFSLARATPHFEQKNVAEVTAKPAIAAMGLLEGRSTPCRKSDLRLPCCEETKVGHVERFHITHATHTHTHTQIERERERERERGGGRQKCPNNPSQPS
jgi:hypothetical protein